MGGLHGAQGERVAAAAAAEAFAAQLRCCLAAQLSQRARTTAMGDEEPLVLEALGAPTLVRVKLQPLDADGQPEVAIPPTERTPLQVR